MKRTWVFTLGGFLLAAAVAAALGVWASGGSSAPAPAPTKPTTHYTSGLGKAIIVTQPATSATISSPVHIVGKVPGVWSFEASFGAEVVDADHKPLGEHYATVQGEWMTEADVPFTADVKFKKPTTDTGFVVLHNANPSGDQSHADSVEIPVRF